MSQISKDYLELVNQAAAFQDVAIAFKRQGLIDSHLTETEAVRLAILGISNTSVVSKLQSANDTFKLLCRHFDLTGLRPNFDGWQTVLDRTTSVINRHTSDRQELSNIDELLDADGLSASCVGTMPAIKELIERNTRQAKILVQMEKDEIELREKLKEADAKSLSFDRIREVLKDYSKPRADFDDTVSDVEKLLDHDSMVVQSSLFVRLEGLVAQHAPDAYAHTTKSLLEQVALAFEFRAKFTDLAGSVGRSQEELAFAVQDVLKGDYERIKPLGVFISEADWFDKDSIQIQVGGFRGYAPNVHKMYKRAVNGVGDLGSLLRKHGHTNGGDYKSVHFALEGLIAKAAKPKRKDAAFHGLRNLLLETGHEKAGGLGLTKLLEYTRNELVFNGKVKELYNEQVDQLNRLTRIIGVGLEPDTASLVRDRFVKAGYLPTNASTDNVLMCLDGLIEGAGDVIQASRNDAKRLLVQVLNTAGFDVSGDETVDSITTRLKLHKNNSEFNKERANSEQKAKEEYEAIFNDLVKKIQGLLLEHGKEYTFTGTNDLVAELNRVLRFRQSSGWVREQFNKLGCGFAEGLSYEYMFKRVVDASRENEHNADHYNAIVGEAEKMLHEAGFLVTPHRYRYALTNALHVLIGEHKKYADEVLELRLKHQDMHNARVIAEKDWSNQYGKLFNVVNEVEANLKRIGFHGYNTVAIAVSDLVVVYSSLKDENTKLKAENETLAKLTNEPKKFEYVFDMSKASADTGILGILQSENKKYADFVAKLTKIIGLDGSLEDLLARFEFFVVTQPNGLEYDLCQLGQYVVNELADAETAFDGDAMRNKIDDGARAIKKLKRRTKEVEQLEGWKKNSDNFVFGVRELFGIDGDYEQMIESLKPKAEQAADYASLKQLHGLAFERMQRFESFYNNVSGLVGFDGPTDELFRMLKISLERPTYAEANKKLLVFPGRVAEKLFHAGLANQSERNGDILLDKLDMLLGHWKRTVNKGEGKEFFVKRKDANHDKIAEYIHKVGTELFGEPTPPLIHCTFKGTIDESTGRFTVLPDADNSEKVSELAVVDMYKKGIIKYFYFKDSSIAKRRYIVVYINGNEHDVSKAEFDALVALRRAERD